MRKRLAVPIALHYSELQRNIGKIIAFSLAYASLIKALPQALAKLCGSDCPAARINWSMVEVKKGYCIDRNGVSL